MPEVVTGAEGATFHASGRGTGVVGLVMVAAALAYGAFASAAHYAAWVWPLLVLVAVLVWCVLLRPRVRLTADTLELHNPLSTRFVALGAVEDIAVRQVARVRVGGRVLTCAGAGRTRRVIRRDARLGGDAPIQDFSAGAVLEHSVRHRAAELAALGNVPEPAVRRTWAWPELAAIAATAVAAAVLALI